MKDHVKLFIENCGKKTVRIEDIESHLVRNFKLLYEREGGFLYFVRLIEELCIDGVLSPIRSKGKLGTKLYNVYRKIEQEKEPFNPDFIRLLLNKYHPKMALSSYAKDYEGFFKEKIHFDKINDFLHRGDTDFISVNERSFELFHDEKWLNQNKSVLQRINVTLDDLYCYPTYEPFFEYRRYNLSEPSYNILIIENKDTYYTLKRLLVEGIHTFHDVSISMLVYGEGDKILNSISYINEIEELKLLDYHFFYFGDLDPRGMSIFSSLEKKVELKPFLSFYYALLNKYKDIDPPLRKKEQVKSKPSSYASFLKYFDQSTSQRVLTMVEEKGQYLPQEGVNRKDFIELSRSQGER